MTFEQLSADAKTLAAINYEILVLGEAASRPAKPRDLRSIVTPPKRLSSRTRRFPGVGVGVDHRPVDLDRDRDQSTSKRPTANSCGAAGIGEWRTEGPTVSVGGGCLA